MRLAVLGKDALLRDALAGMLANDGSMEVVTTGGEARDVVAKGRQGGADAFVVDAAGVTDSELQFLMGAVAGGDIAFVAVTEKDREEELKGAGATVISRHEGGASLLNALRKIRPRARGTREGRRSYGDRDELNLSRREIEVAQLVAKGMSNRRIATTTGLREQSVKNLVSVVMRKLGCENRTQVALKLHNVPVALPEA